MRNKIILPIASAVLASSLVFAVPAQAEENLVPTIVNEEVSTNEVVEVPVDTTVEAPIEATTEVTDTTNESTEVVEVNGDTETVSEEVYEDIVSEVEEEISVVDPDSFFYSFKVFFEEVRLFFTFDDEKKAELLVQLANERLLEADFAAEKGDLELVKELIAAYEAKIAALEELATDSESVTNETYDINDSVIEETYDSGESVLDETYNENSYKLKNIAALTKVYNKVPDHVKPIIQRNIQKAIEKREAHIAKKKLKYSTTEGTVETETIEEVESEATINTVEISGEENASVSKEKANKKQTSIETTEVDSNESNLVKEPKGNQGKGNGKDNKGNSGR